MTTKFQPLLSGKAPDDLTKLHFPLMASPKLDGIRCVIKDGEALTRKLKAVPNQFIQSILGNEEYEGLDGELIVGQSNAPNTWNASQSGVMSIEGRPQFMFHVFDDFTLPDQTFNSRYVSAKYRANEAWKYGAPLVSVPHVVVNNFDDLIRWQTTWVGQGYEGVMLRDPEGRYKFGRSTDKEGILLKLKIWNDAEGKVFDFVERMKNTSEAEIDERGYVKRNKRKDNVEPRGDLGALVCTLIQKGATIGPTFEIGTGFDDAQRKKIWDNRDAYIGKRAKFKYQDLTPDGIPRFPVFLGFRDARD